MPTKDDCCLSCTWWRVPHKGHWGTCERGDVSAFGVHPIATSDTMHCGGFTRELDSEEVMRRRNRETKKIARSRYFNPTNGDILLIIDVDSQDYWTEVIARSGIIRPPYSFDVRVNVQFPDGRIAPINAMYLRATGKREHAPGIGVTELGVSNT